MAKEPCKSCILCGSDQLERRRRVLIDILRLRSAKYECHHCHCILYRKHRPGLKTKKWRNATNSGLPG